MYERIVVGTDGSTRALDAIRTAGELARLCGLSEVHVVAAGRVVPPGEFARIQATLPEEYHDLLDPMIESQDRLDEARDVLSPDVAVVPHALSGDAADAILHVAETVDADLIVVGARGLNALERFVRGSVSTRVAHHSPCDVLVVEHDD